MDKAYPIKQPVIIVWEDAYSIDEWFSEQEIKKDNCPLIHTCGFLIENTKHRIVVTSNYDPNNENLSCTMVIPKGMVKKIIKLDLD